MAVEHSSALLKRFLSPKILVVAFVSTALLTWAGLYATQRFLAEAAKPNTFAELEAMTILQDPRLQGQLVRSADADYRYNCHGWTFTRGQREVDGEEVEQRLAEEYQSTKTPQQNDIIVYRDHVGQVMHSGVVRTIGRDGRIVIESKWGTAGRFLHEPTIERTFASFDFYKKVPDLAKHKETKQAEVDTLDTLSEEDY